MDNARDFQRRRRGIFVEIRRTISKLRRSDIKVIRLRGFELCFKNIFRIVVHFELLQ